MLNHSQSFREQPVKISVPYYKYFLKKVHYISTILTFLDPLNSIQKTDQRNFYSQSWLLFKTNRSSINVSGLFIFQGPIGYGIRTTVRIRWSFAQMCCAMSLVCPSIAAHCMCQFWACGEHVNMPKTIESSAKCGVHAVIRFLYSEQATRNVVLRYCPSSWQCSAAYCSCYKEAPEAFSMGSVWSPTIICPDLAPCDFHLFPHNM